MSKIAGIYIHIPFCAARCHYCNFATGGYESELAWRYTEALRDEIERADVSADLQSCDLMRRVDTIYFGGGTPTTLTVGQISSLIEACRRRFDLAPDSEITAEANPGSISQNYLEELRSAGVNRLSFGAQSFDDGELRMIGRTHSAEDARDAVRSARAAGFTNVSIDLIAGLPEQKMETWRRNLDEAFALAPDHLSVYLLELYKDAPLLHRINRGELRAIDDELTVEMYFALTDEAERRGFERYEISNWARPGFESRHNLKYWIGAPYWAFGISAAGYDGRLRWSNTRNIHEYLTKIEGGQSPIVERIELDDDDRQSENLFLRLRLKDGVDLDEHLRRFGVDALERYRDEIERLREAGLIELGENRLKISRAGTVLANEVFAAFV
ncbi:MAG TPA: radical SAM family heme chaperone HemW [Blastocatellia bacterium]|jgi:oxygen-independent coproporphyrinogen-3 oxidase|nr:radical SAM family heme chaperone HemW [Blastocatellia bacterium]